MYYLFRFVCLLTWMFGILLAKGFWSTLFAIVMPLWSWYLAIEYAAKHFGLI